jgi:hypothetical protein
MTWPVAGSLAEAVDQQLRRAGGASFGNSDRRTHVFAFFDETLPLTRFDRVTCITLPEHGREPLTGDGSWEHAMSTDPSKKDTTISSADNTETKIAKDELNEERLAKASGVDLHFTKLVDKSSLNLFEAAATGKHIPWRYSSLVGQPKD